MRRFNEWLAIHLSEMFATMLAFYLFTVLALLPLAWPAAMPYVQFISSGVLQLIALPLLAVSGVIIGRKADARAEADHQAIMELVADLHAKHDALHAKIDGQYDDGR
ncbi:MAG: hypothetical protein PHZ23_15885 [Acidiphilium sp.]|nr:hypothetical protein [Acidiphilium sp.]